MIRFGELRRPALQQRGKACSGWDGLHGGGVCLASSPCWHTPYVLQRFLATPIQDVVKLVAPELTWGRKAGAHVSLGFLPAGVLAHRRATSWVS